MASNSRRWLIFFPVALLALWSTVVKADALGDWTASQSCANSGSVEVVNNSILINGPDGNGCSGQPHWTKIETTIPNGVNSVSFDWSYWTNDGAYYDPPQYAVNGVYTQLTQQNTASGSLTVPVVVGDIFTFRQYSIDTCCAPGHLQISNLSLWEFTTTSTTPTTTTTTITVPETTVLVTSTTSTTVPETSTLTSTTSTTTSTTSTSTTSTTTTTTTSTTLPEPEPTLFLPTTTEPESTTTTEVMLPEETTTTVEEVTTTTEEVTTTSETPIETTTTVEPNLEPNLEPLAEKEVTALIAKATTTEELVAALEKLTPEQVEQVVDQILAQEQPPTPEQAVALATSPEVLSVVTPQQAVEIFESLDVAELSTEEKNAVTEAVQSAPLEVRQAFEDTIDIFSDDFGNYVPVGSSVPVNTRRTLIAVAAGATTIAISRRKR
jgi:hypothetical protein